MADTPPDRPGIEQVSLDILEHNTIAVLTQAPDRLTEWRATVAQALDDTLARRPGDTPEIELFQALLALLDGGDSNLPGGLPQGGLPPEHRYGALWGRIVDGIENPAPARLIPDDMLEALVTGTGGAMSGDVDMEAWRAGLVHAMDDARSRGAEWVMEVELFEALLALLDGQTPAFPDDHRYAETLAAAVDAVEAASDPSVVALSTWLNADRQALDEIWREHEAVFRAPEFVETLGPVTLSAAADTDDPEMAKRVLDRIALLREWLGDGANT